MHLIQRTKPSQAFGRAALSILSVLALVGLAACSPSVRQISVSGQGNVSFVPDLVSFSVTVSNTNPRLEDSLAQTKATVGQILAVCKEFQMADADIKTSFVSSGKEYAQGNYDKPPVFVGYSATQTIQLQYRQLERFEAFSAALLALRISDLGGLSFGHSALSDYSSQADLLALDDARQAAEKIATRMGVKLGRVVFVSNTENAGGPGPFLNGFRAAETFNKSLNTGITVAPGILSVQRQVHAVFEIE